LTQVRHFQNRTVLGYLPDEQQ